MADCASLLDEELSSFVFNYLTENSCSQYGEEEVSSDRLDTDFPDIDLSQLDTSDFDTVNCLSELQWCSDHPVDESPASVHCSTADELFEIEEENAALLAALTDSLDRMVDAAFGELHVFPSLEEEPNQEEEVEDGLPLIAEDFSQSLGAETEDPSLLKKLLLTPPNVPAGIDAHKDGVHSHRYSNRSLHLRTVRPLVKSDVPQERKPRAVRPGRLCTELHRHLTTSHDTEDAVAPDTEEDEEEEEDEDSESEEEEEEEGEEEESSSSEVEGAAAVVAAPAEPAKPQFSSEKELHSVVELITYMHTYCLPTRKQQGWDCKDRDFPRPRARPEASRPAHTNSHSRVVLVATPGTSGGVTGTGSNAPKRLPFARRREVKPNSLLRELLQQSSSFDVSKPYRLHSPPYSTSHSPNRGVPAPSAPLKSVPAQSPSSTSPKPELRKDSPSLETRNYSSEATQSLEETMEDSGSFSVRRSRRLASFPSRFAKRLRPGRARDREEKDKEEREDGRAEVKLLPTQAGGGTTTGTKPEQRTAGDSSAGTTKPTKPCCHNEKRACLCLPLNPKSTGESQYSTKPFEQTLSVDLCGTAGLTPPTTPPHKPVDEDLFKPAEGGKGVGGASGGSGGDGDGSESVHPASNTHANGATKGSSWLSRSHHQRKLPQQTELYAQLRRMGQAGDSDTHRKFGDHDYCALSLGERRKRSAAMLGAMLQAQGGCDAVNTPAPKAADDQVMDGKENEETLVMSEVEEMQEQQATEVLSSQASECQSAAATPPASEEEAECSSASRSPSPILHLCPDSPASKTDSSENSEICPDDKQRNKAKSDEDNCQVFYIHNLPSSVTQNMLRKRFQVFGKAEDCKVIICNEERCGVIKIRQSGVQRHWRERETGFQNGPGGLRRLTRKRYIDLDEAGPGPVKSKYDALDFDTLLMEAQKSLHR
ncbi:peroxisome proliferator-activated receptor gamma coactivator 1-beta isoform X2 [Mastacembelus armatus]|uniref:Peroxisome proliferator-activated receptor gamma, coactivator 1 beta n=1 Tax=Mastacembelus armatus TaxID=205130 RepID=A0A3Q3M0G4_9TELE|nr:peroxisome proliferator-activated receptor gamma coactivator 1-beta isoform X2 [Mastacembelus armatus]